MKISISFPKACISVATTPRYKEGTVLVIFHSVTFCLVKTVTMKTDMLINQENKQKKERKNKDKQEVPAFFWQDLHNTWLIQQFCNNERHNSAAFAEVVKVMYYTWLWYTLLTWYSPNISRWISMYGLKHVFEIHDFTFI